MTKTQRWDWAIGLRLDVLDEKHLHAAYKLNWDNLCKFDGCRKNCKKVLCLGCFDRSWIDNDNVSNSFDSYDNSNFEEKRTNLKTFVGLKNLGATCYVNCLLQLWFHNPALRKAIYEWKHIDFEHETGDGRSVGDNGDSQVLSICDSREEQRLKSPNKQHSATVSQSKRALENVDEFCPSPAKKSVKRDDKERSDSNKSPINSSKQIARVETLKRSSSPKVRIETSPSDNTKSLQKASPNSNKELIPTNPIEQLQLIFARLQFTNKKSIDPYNFIESLALNAAEQQDAQEFGNLFMEFLERTFSNQPNSFVSKIIQTQFCGKYSYATTCDNCRHSSLTESKFYELDLSIQNLETLHDCLSEYFRPVVLDGKYDCGFCQKAQSAHRKIILKSLPPTLNLQLLRFVYDVQRNVRQKLNSHLIFPEVLDMNPYLNNNNSNPSIVKHQLNSMLGSSQNNNNYSSNNNNSITRQQQHSQKYSLDNNNNKSNIYFLSAVLIHRGSSPHSGHYIAHIKDRISKDWYKFNDDKVERIGPQLQISTDGENISIVEDKTEHIKILDPSSGKMTRIESKSLKSKTAYMLVYQAQDNEALTYPRDHSEKWQLPEHLQTAVAEENSRSEEIFESLQLAREVDLQIMDARRNQVRTLYNKLVCRSPDEKFEFINKKWLQNWLTNSSTTVKFAPIDNTELLCIHDKLDFRKIDQAKCVRSEGADELYKEYGGEGPRLIDAMCRDCVQLEIKLIQLKERMKEDQKFITSQAKFKLDASYDFNDAYIVGKNSYRDWQALVMVQFKKSHPELLKRRQQQAISSTPTTTTKTTKGNDNSNQHGDSDDEAGSSRNKSAKENQAPSSTTTTTSSRTMRSNDRSQNVDNINNNNNNNNGGQEANSDSESDDEAMERFVFNSDILCDHDQLINDTTAWRIVPKEVWQIFKNYFGNDESRPLIESNANTIMCADCKRQEVKQQEIGDAQKQKACEQKAKLSDLFHNKKRASWFNMKPGDVFYALDKKFLTKWQKFLRNPCNQEQPTEIIHLGKLICTEHFNSLYDHNNSNPILPECPFVLITKEELNILCDYYPMDCMLKFKINPEYVDRKIMHYVVSSTSQTSSTSSNNQKANNNSNNSNNNNQSTTSKSQLPTTLTSNPATSRSGQHYDSDQPSIDGATATATIDIKSSQSDSECEITQVITTSSQLERNLIVDTNSIQQQQQQQQNISMFDNPGNFGVGELVMRKEQQQRENKFDLQEIDWSDCICCKPNFCLFCYEIMKEQELEKLLNYDSATIYITRVEGVSPTIATNGTNNNNNNNLDHASSELNISMANNNDNNCTSLLAISGATGPNSASPTTTDDGGDDSKSRRRNKVYAEDEANDFVPPGASKLHTQTPTHSASSSGAPLSSPGSSLLRRTTRRNRNRQQAYTIKPNQTLLELKKEIFARCQVLPVDQRLFLNDQLLDDNSKTMSDFKIVPNCSLKLEVSRHSNIYIHNQFSINYQYNLLT